MAIFGISNPRYYGGQKQSGVGSFLKNLSLKYRGTAKVVKGSEFRPGAPVQEKPVVRIEPDYLKLAAGNEGAAANLEKTMNRIKEAAECFPKIKYAGHNVELRGYEIDRRGNLTCSMKNTGTGKDFTISLGNVEDSASLKSAIFDHFNLSAADRLRTSYSGMLLA